MKYGKTIHWTCLNGDYGSVSVKDCDTINQAMEGATRMALRAGWTNPKWWQCWRWADTRIDPLIVGRMRHLIDLEQWK